MTYLPDTADQSRPGFDPAALDRTDRILLGSCAVIWLAALGAGVAATVALVDLAHGPTGSGDPGTPWFLYTVIGVSAAVIIAAVPLLLRARRGGSDGSSGSPGSSQTPEESPEPPAPARGPDAPTEKLRAATVTAEAGDPPPRLLRTDTPEAVSPEVDQTYLRFGVTMLAAMGVATLLTGVATYLMAVDTETVAWVLYVVAGVVTVGMGAVVWYFLRELGTHTAAGN